MSGEKSGGRVGSSAPVLILVGVLGLAVYGMQAPRLGLYQDDWIHFVAPLLSEQGADSAYIFSDTDHRLQSQRPLVYVALLSGRTAFALAGTVGLHLWILFLHLSTAVLAALALRALTQRVLVPGLLVGALYTVYPLATTMLVWPATMHHFFGVLLGMASMAAAACWYRGPSKGRLLQAVVAYVLSLLSSEVMVFVPLVFVGMIPWVMREGGSGGLRRVRNPLTVSLIGAGILWVAWRGLIQPQYGWENYPNPVTASLLSPEKMASGWLAFLNPWPVAVEAIFRGPLPVVTVLLAMVATGALVVGITRTLSREEERERVEGASSDTPLKRLCVLGLCLTAAGMIPALLSSASLYQLNSLDARMNCGALFGSVLTVTAAVLLFARSSLSWKGSMGFSPAFVGVLVAVSLSIILVFVTSPWGIGMSEPARHFMRLQALGFALGAALLPALRRCSWMVGFIVGVMFLIGALFQIRTQETFSDRWSEHQILFRQMKQMAPRFESGTLVILKGVDQKHVLEGTPEMTVALGALYGDPTLAASPLRWLKFRPEGAVPSSLDQPVPWPYRGPREHRRDVGFRVEKEMGLFRDEDVVILEWDGSQLRLLEGVEVPLEVGGHRFLRSNARRMKTDAGPAADVDWRILGR